VLLPSCAHVSELLEAVALDRVAASPDESMKDGCHGSDDVLGGGGGDNMLGMPGAFAGHLMRDDSSGSHQDQAMATSSPPAASRVPSALDGLPDHLSALLPHPLRLSDLRWQSYKSFLAGRNDVYGNGMHSYALFSGVPPFNLPTHVPSLARILQSVIMR
jgi:hypothetical protein